MAVLSGTSGPDTLTGGAEADEIYGFDSNDSLSGGSGNDTLDGGAGADTMDGGEGRDLCYVDNAGDVLSGSGISGDDRVITSVDYSIAGVIVGSIGELRAVSGLAPINLTGGVYRESLIGNDGPNRIDGGPGGGSRFADTMQGLRGDDTYVVRSSFNLAVEEPGQGNDLVLVADTREGGIFTLTAVQLAGFNAEIETIAMADAAATFGYYINGNQYAQTLIGNAGASSLEGAGGADTLIGFQGDDNYYVSTRDTVIIENAGEGFDTVLASVDYTLPATASIELLTTRDGSSRINLTGNAASQTLQGNNAENIINGFGGADTMIGLGGNDTFLVRGPGDQVVEANGGGVDTVFTTVSYNLGVNEVEVLSTVTNADTTAINLIGNFASQTVVGNYGDNVLNGGSGGLDTLIGLRGNDVYAVGDSRTVVVENAGEGTDTVVVAVDYSLAAGVSVEVLAAQDRSGTAALTLRGNDLSQTIAGNDGANVIDGGSFPDTLIGGGGADRFLFTTSLGQANVDSLPDFTPGVDTIGLSSTVFGIPTMTAERFAIDRLTTPDQRILYERSSGVLYLDPDGSGPGTSFQFAALPPGLNLTSASFEIV